ncbi:histidine kinase [Pseudoalteromonas sp. S3776]|uniref:histidine kinase n=1 Tax=Pseudoalteromonas sp. S3776 TaxID=579544 RepID=UPI001108D8ED|nr:histidine kinase [Pseudoalteromonas sp. S3776]TMO80763.1 histidine kinase [Pseudoalteromonas sp. S3776]
MSEEKEVNTLNKLVHDARAPLNRISMNAELIKLVLENDMPKDKALAALDKIISNCQQCSERLQNITDFNNK